MSELTVRAAEKAVRGIKVLDGVDLSCSSGRIVGLCGANGSGKTMLLRAITGLMYLDRGHVEFDGNRLGRDIDFIPRTGVLIENPAFLARYTAVQNLAFIAAMSGAVDDDHIRCCVAAVGLDPDDRRRYRQFSLGMRQRLGIAAAIMGHPQLVVLDEPTNALDESGFDLMGRIATDIRRRQAMCIVASHDPDVLRAMADEIVRMKDGKVVGRETVRAPAGTVRADGRAAASPIGSSRRAGEVPAV